jgi:hypothetical protein
MSSIRHALFATGLAALLALNGCGSADPTKEVAATSDDSSAQKSSGDYPTQKKSACEVLSVEVAKSLLGSVGDETAPVPDTGSADITVSTCVRANAVAGSDKAPSVSLLMRVAKSATGATSNEAVFAKGSLPSNAEVVDGYGEQAFWNPAYGQLNILKDGNWYILSSGPIDPTKHTLAETSELADAIIDQL